MMKMVLIAIIYCVVAGDGDTGGVATSVFLWSCVEDGWRFDDRKTGLTTFSEKWRSWHQQPGTFQLHFQPSPTKQQHECPRRLETAIYLYKKLWYPPIYLDRIYYTQLDQKHNHSDCHRATGIQWDFLTAIFLWLLYLKLQSLHDRCLACIRYIYLHGFEIFFLHWKEIEIFKHDILPRKLFSRFPSCYVLKRMFKYFLAINPYIIDTLFLIRGHH